MGENNPNTITALNNLANQYSETGDHKKALELHEAAYKKRKKILGEKHPGTINSLYRLALDYASLGDNKKARKLLESDYEIALKALGEDNITTQKIKQSLETL